MTKKSQVALFTKRAVEMLYLVEHFFSIQGEGKYVGTPSIFFRLGGCNMRCPGFHTLVTTPDGTTVEGCDTAYAVFQEAFKSTWQPIETTQTLEDILHSYARTFLPDVVFTGGEPLLYAHDPIFYAFVSYVIQKGHRITFETNASIEIDFDRFPLYKACTFALSVKLANSGEPLNKRIASKALDAFVTHAKECFFKFTVDDIKQDSAEIAALQARYARTPIYCMPLSDSKAMLEANSQAVIDFCKSNGYIYSDRLHIRIWDEIQGV